jgi:arylsulfatase A
MTGLYNYRNYECFEYLNPEEYSIGELMKDAGYKTAIAGKWQLNGRAFQKPGWENMDKPFEFGFDEFCLWQVNKPKDQGERFADPLIVKNGEEMTGLENSYGPDVFADFITDFIKKNKEEPFFIYYPMVLVHNPFVPTPDTKAWSEPERRYENDTAYFKDMVEYTDKIVGRIVNTLEKEGLNQNTLLIFTGDNGTHSSIYTRMPDGPYKGGKGQTIDAGTRVPLVISWPAIIKEPFEYNGLVEFSDFYATLAELTEQDARSDGVSLVPLIKGETLTHRETAFVHYNPVWGNFVPARFIRTLDFKLYQDGRFYNIKMDPREMNPIDTSLMEGTEEENYNYLKTELLKHREGDVAEEKTW